MRRILALSCLPLLVAVTTLARAEEPAAPGADAARTAYERGMQLFRDRSFDAAAEAFAESHAIDPKRETLFAQAQATRLAGRCDLAVPLYEQFLTTEPSPPQIEATRLALARCAELPPRPPVVAPPSPEAPPLPPPPPTPVAESGRRDALAIGLMIGGAVAGGVGAGIVAMARADAQEMRPGESLAAYEDRRAGAELRVGIGVAAITVGAVAALAGVGRAVWLAVHPQGGVLALQGRF